MERLKCSVCGAELSKKSKTEFFCEYCENTFTVKEEIPQDIIISMNIACHELRNLSFGRARNAYSNIAESGCKLAEVFWCLVLCKYGIEYIHDARTNKYLPTCHRMSSRAVTEDEDYLKVLEYAENKADYESKAEQIEKTRLGILELAKKAESYEVFICYKQDDENGRPTEESLFVTDVYNQLKNHGVKVFLARKCIPLGSDYEPYIFNALETSKVMLLMCAKKKYIESTWVVNEWDRFVDIVAHNRNRFLIPIFDMNFNPYDLPDKLSELRLQGLKRGDFDFAEKLLDHIGGVLGRSLRISETNEELEKQKKEKEKQYSKANAALMLKNYSRAKDSFEAYVEEYSMDYKGWLGLAKVYTKNFTDYLDEQHIYFLECAENAANEEEKELIRQEYNTYKIKAEEAKRANSAQKERERRETEAFARENERREAEAFAREKERRDAEARAREDTQRAAQARAAAELVLKESERRKESERESSRRAPDSALINRLMTDERRDTATVSKKNGCWLKQIFDSPRSSAQSKEPYSANMKASSALASIFSEEEPTTKPSATLMKAVLMMSEDEEDTKPGIARNIALLMRDDEKKGKKR